MAASTAPAAKQKILDLLAARAGLAGVAIEWSGPLSEAAVNYEMIHFRGPVTRDPGWEVLGGARLDEHYTVTLGVYAFKADDTEKAIEARAWALIDEIEQAIRANLNLDALLYDAIEFGEQSVETGRDGNTWIGYGTVALNCHARI
jgi:hypothetical protein